MKTRIAPLALAAVLALGGAACDGNAQDDLDNVQDNIEEGAEEVGDAVEEGAEEVGDAVEDGGDAIEEGTDEVGDDNGHTDGEE